jgi:hypothetical protein
MEEIEKNFGKDVDSFLRLRDDSKVNMARAKMELLNMGVKTYKDGQLTFLPGLNVDKFLSCNNQEFQWEAEYEDGNIVRQFGNNGKDSHYGNIDQSKLKLFRWISNFDYATDNPDKRIIVELDFTTGKFNFYNGFIPQQVRGDIRVMDGFKDNVDGKKLIMKIIKRTTTSLSYPDGAVDEVCYYNRYIIGWETSSEKCILCIEPNGNINLFKDK